MSQLSTNHVKIVGVSACVPRTVEENIDLPLYESKEEVKKIMDGEEEYLKRNYEKYVSSGKWSYSPHIVENYLFMQY